MRDKLHLSEAELLELSALSELPAGEYMLEVSVENLLGVSTSVEVTFAKESTPLPVVDFGSSVIEFPVGRPLVLNPIQGALSCGSDFAYEWRVLSGSLQLTTTDKSFVKISREQVQPGAEYGIQLAILEKASGSVLLSDTVVVMVGVSELQLVLEGASSYVSTEPFSLVATLSDPDKSIDATKYEWKCDGICFTGDAVPEIAGNIYTVGANALDIGTYTFIVVAEKGTRRAESKITVDVIDGTGNPPTGSITVIGSGSFPNRPVGSETELRLQAVLSEDAVPAEQVAYEWQVAAELVVDGAVYTDSVVIKAGALVPGEDMTFSVRMTNTATQASSIATRTVTVNSKPACVQASCAEVTPESGTAHGETTFTVMASGFEDINVLLGATDQRLTYQFGYCRELDCPTERSFIPLVKQAATTFSITSLPVGSGDASQVTLMVCALDEYLPSGSILSRACAMRNVVVTAPSEKPDLTGVVGALSTNTEASSFERLVVGQSVVSQLRQNQPQDGEEEGEDDGVLATVFGVMADIDVGDLPPESLQVLTDTLQQAAGGRLNSEVSIAPRISLWETGMLRAGAQCRLPCHVGCASLFRAEPLRDPSAVRCSHAAAESRCCRTWRSSLTTCRTTLSHLDSASWKALGQCSVASARAGVVRAPPTTCRRACRRSCPPSVPSS